MKITRKSQLTGKVHTMEIPVNTHELDLYVADPDARIQDAFPELTPEQREFIISGITPEEWATIPREEDDDSALPDILRDFIETTVERLSQLEEQVERIDRKLRDNNRHAPSGEDAA